jgi:hypothetical protein
VSEWHSYCRGEHPHSQAQLDPQARTVSGVHTWLQRRVPPAKPWADDVLNEVEALLQDEIARLGGPQALEARDRVDLSTAGYAGIARRLCEREWEAQGLAVDAREGLPGFIGRDWRQMVMLEKKALESLHARHVARADAPRSVSEWAARQRAEVIDVEG